MIDPYQILAGILVTVLSAFIIWVFRAIWIFKGHIDSAFIKIRYMEREIKEMKDANVSREYRRPNRRSNGHDAFE